MADDLSGAPSGGGETTTVDSGTSTTQDAGQQPGQPRPSLRDTITRAAAKVSEQEQAAAVLRDGAGADEKAVSEADKANAASERAQKGWETRRTNQEQANAQAAEEAKNKQLGKTIANAVKDGQAAAQQNQQQQTQQTQQATQSAHPTAPTRFMKEAQAAWDQTPEVVRVETHRALNELEQGFAKHKEGAERWSELAEFDTMAKQHGTTVKDALRNYINADQMLAQDPVKGVEHILAARGIKLHDFAQYVLDQANGTASPSQDPLIAELRQTVSTLQNELNSYKTNQQQGTRQKIDAEVAEFQKTHPRVADPAFESEMAFLISAGRAKTLQEAYDLAERLIPAAKGPNVANHDPAAQTRKAELSPTGAPGAGSNPAGAATPRSKSIREAIQRASQRVG